MIDFLKEQGFSILSALILAVATYIGSKFKAFYEEKMNDRTKRQVVKETVKMVEQVYKSFDGPAKFEKAKENIIFMLNEKGINISELELTTLIESVVAEFNIPALSETYILDQSNIKEDESIG